MFTEEFIKEIIKDNVKIGVKNFALYPYGTNGLQVGEILKNYFDIEPFCIIDNNWCEYNPKILSIEQFITNHQQIFSEKESSERYKLILTIEENKLHDTLINYLRKYINDEFIVDLLTISKYRNKKLCTESVSGSIPNEYVKKRLSLDHIIPNDKKDTFTSTMSVKKVSIGIKVRIVHSLYCTWNALLSLCEAFNKDNYFDLLIIIGQDMEVRQIQQVINAGFRYQLWDEYRAEDDQPDILILSHPYDTRTVLPKIQRYLKLVIVVSSQLTLNEDSIGNFWNVQKRGYERFDPDYYIYDSMLYKHIMELGFTPNNIQMLEMGNPKFDMIYHDLLDKSLPDSWKKLTNMKKIFLWAPDHGYSHKHINGCTFDMNAKDFFAYAKEHNNIGFIFRPHTTMMSELVWQGYWSMDDVEMIKNYCKASPNIIFDDNETYGRAYSIADGIITDAVCGITCSALATMKPVCAMFRSPDQVIRHKEIVCAYHKAYSFSDIKRFIEMVIEGNDYKYDIRKMCFEKYINKLEGTNGIRIKNFIENKYIERVQS